MLFYIYCIIIIMHNGDLNLLREIDNTQKDFLQQQPSDFSSDSRISMTISEHNESMPQESYRSLYKISGPFTMVSNWTLDKDSPNKNGWLLAENSRYMFKLTTHADPVKSLLDQNWMYNDYWKRLPSTTNTYEKNRGVIKSLSETKPDRIFSPGILLPNFNLLNLHDNDQLTNRSVNRVGQNMVSVEFDYSHANKYTIRSRIIYDLSQHGFPLEIEEFSVNSGEKYKSNSNRIVLFSGNKIELTVRTKSETTSPGKSPRTVDLKSSTTYTFGTIPESEFTLTAFGLPEPEGVIWEKPTPTWVWLSTAAGLLILFAIFSRLLQKRFAAKQVAA